MSPVVLDTDAASLIHKRRLPPKLAGRLVATTPVITFVTMAELTKWMHLRDWGTRNRDALAAWLATIPVLPGDEDVAMVWGALAAAAVRRGRPRPVNDMWIAACCLTHGLPLVTLNVKDFADFATHHGLDLITT
ncbi:type II toxin-antitoxin system VapC family toxin [Nonomuraea sp. NPDC050790]|uniref:type II toxin-antitoxin system VapC family toxin n=1 Tax=Nonomuraea sp. NPDC050790 TaxID=3364371 RepID=UPI0037B9C181